MQLFRKKLFKTWELYFFKEINKLFWLFIGGFYLLYILIDYSSRASSLQDFTYTDLFSYYSLVFVKRLEIILPFAILISTIRTLCALNQHNELVAMLAGGVQMKRLMRPFLIFGSLVTLFMLLSMQFIVPYSLKKIQKIEDSYLEPSERSAPSVHAFMLNDETSLIYQSYDSAKERFFDLYWIVSKDELYRMKMLFPDEKYSVARFVDRFIRDESGFFKKVESSETKVFKEISLDQETLETVLREPDELSISALYQRLPHKGSLMTDTHQRVLTWFYAKLALPFLCLLAVIAPISYCVQFTRQLPIFLIYTLSILSLVSFYFIIDSALIFSEEGVIPAFWAILPPFALSFGFFGTKFYKIG